MCNVRLLKLCTASLVLCVGAVEGAKPVVRSMNVESTGQVKKSVVRKVQAWPFTGSKLGLSLGASEKLPIIKDAQMKICQTFPGNICDSLIKGARAPQRRYRELGKSDWSKTKAKFEMRKWTEVEDNEAETVIDQGAKLRATMGRKLASGKPFVFASFGSSISAGHDNHYNTSWAFELERILKPTFEKLGFGFELRQRAVGGWGEAPYTAGCLHNRAGSGIDAVSWEWGLFHDSRCAVEGFLREAYSLNGGDHPPVVVSLESTGLKVDLLQQPPGDRAGEGDRATIRTDIRASTFSYQDLEGKLAERRWKPTEWYLSDEFISKQEVRLFAERVKLPHAASLFTPNSLGEASSSFATEEVEGLTGMKPTKEQQADMDKLAAAVVNKEMPTPQVMGPAMKFVDAGFGLESFFTTSGVKDIPDEWKDWYLAREKAFNINWHPGPLGHLLIASQMAHFFLEQVRLALLEEPLNDQVPVAPPPTKECGAGVPRSCATGMFVHSGPDIKDIVKPGHSFEQGISIDQQFAENCIDHRKPLRINATSDPLVLNVEGQKGDIAVVCMAPCAWHCKGHKGLLGVGASRFWNAAKLGVKPAASDVDFSLDGRPVSTQKLIELNEQVFGEEGSYCAGCQSTHDVCQAVGELSSKHELSMSVNPQGNYPDDKEKFVEILQLMVVPGPNSVTLAPEPLGQPHEKRVGLVRFN